MEKGVSYDERKRIWGLCCECAYLFSSPANLTSGYADRVARLLFGTAAQESGLLWERQRSVAFMGPLGGFSKWQLEAGSISCGLKQIVGSGAVGEKARRFLFNDPHASCDVFDYISVCDVQGAMLLDGNDKIGCLFARLHYLRVKEVVPDEVRAQGEYWKQHYNTVKGSGTVNQYVASWVMLCDDVVGDYPFCDVVRGMTYG